MKNVLVMVIGKALSVSYLQGNGKKLMYITIYSIEKVKRFEIWAT